MSMAAPKPLKVGSKPRKARAAACADTETGCQISELFRVLGKTHMLDILYVVMFEGEGGPRRFVDIQNRLEMSPNTLSERLKELVEAGLLTRTAYNEIPPRVDYAASPKARDLGPVFDTLKAWAGRYNLQPMAMPTAPAAAKSPA